MKRTMVWSLVLSGLALPALALAQSNVTLYGSLDAGVGYVSNLRGNSAFIAEQGTYRADHWGLRGSEDLGGGRRALFRLESGFSTITGNLASAGVLFNREAFVGLADARLGTLTLGRQTDWNFEWLGRLSSAQIIGNFSVFHPGNIDGLANTVPVEVSNAVKYRSPNLGGLTLGAMYSFSNRAGANTTAGYSLAAKYASGPLRAAAAYSNYNDRPLNLAGGLGLTEFAGQALAPGSLFVADNVKIAGAGAAYLWGRWTFHALATDVRISANQQRSSYVALDGGANYQLTPADTLGAGVSSTHFAGKRWTQLSVQDVYAFSKRTQFYASVLYERASANAVADITGIGPASGANQTVVLSGIHHSF